jgi:hypothetical protein
MKTETLYNISADLSALEDLLFEAGGEVPEGEAEAAIDSWFEELGHARDAKVDSYCQLIRNLEARAELRRAEAQPFLTEANRLMARAIVDTNAVGRLKGRLLAFFDRHAIKTLETDRFRVTAAANGGVAPLIIDWEPERLPEILQLTRIEANKKAIRETLESGIELEFARLGERGRSIRIK